MRKRRIKKKCQQKMMSTNNRTLHPQRESPREWHSRSQTTKRKRHRRRSAPDSSMKMIIPATAAILCARRTRRRQHQNVIPNNTAEVAQHQERRKRMTRRGRAQQMMGTRIGKSEKGTSKRSAKRQATTVSAPRGVQNARRTAAPPNPARIESIVVKTIGRRSENEQSTLIHLFLFSSIQN